MMVHTKDGIAIDLAHSDVGQAPGVKGGRCLNSMCVWYRIADDVCEWKRSTERSMLMTKAIVQATDLIDLDTRIGA